jgi:heat shock protein HslJ
MALLFRLGLMSNVVSFLCLIPCLFLFCFSVSAQVKQGSYTGDGTNNRTISVPGITSTFVLIKQDFSPDIVETHNTVVRLKDMTNSCALVTTSISANYTDGITGFMSGGFQLGTNNDVNQSGRTFYWLAIQDIAGEIKTGTYTGNGSDNRDLTGIGFQPDWVMIVNPNNTNITSFRTSTMSSGQSARWNDVLQADEIQSFGSDGFQVGTAASVNTSGTNYYYIAVKSKSNQFNVGTYTGNGVDNRDLTGVGFQPDAFFTRRVNATSPVGVYRFAGSADFALSSGSVATATGSLKLILADGVRLGTSTRVNGNNDVYHWFAFKESSAVSIPTVDLSVTSNTGTEAAQTSITVTATASAAVVGNQTVTLTVTGTNITTGDYTLNNTTSNTVTITIPNGSTTGSVTFKVVDDVLVEGTETATLTISSPSSGITLGSTTTQNITITDNDVAAATTTSISSSLNPSFTGNNVTFTAAVISSGSPVTQGTVTFKEGATTLVTNVALNSSGQATFMTSTLTEGSHIITAIYSGSTGFATSSGTVTQVVNNMTTVSGNTFCNTGTITFKDGGTGGLIGTAATPYPSNIFVSGLSGTIQSITVDLKGLNHNKTRDIDLLLVAPNGATFLMMNGVGYATYNIVNNTNVIDLTLSDAAGSPLPQGNIANNTFPSGTYRPASYESWANTFPAPAPAGPYNQAAPVGIATFGSVFSGLNPNGTWQLYATDDTIDVTGSIANGWCLNITLSCPNPIAYVNQAVAASGDGNTWGTAFKTLQEALTAANNCPSITQVWVAKGTYKPTTGTDRSISFAMKDGVAIYGGFAGGETTLAGRPAVNPLTGNPSTTILSGDIGTVGNNADNSLHVINNPDGLTPTAILDGFVITGGNARDDLDVNNYDKQKGGGMYNRGNPTLTNCSFLNNSAANYGGAMYNEGWVNGASRGTSSPTLTNCLFQSNSAAAGGAMANYGNDFDASSSPTLTNCLFLNNTANGAGGTGGAMFNGASYLSTCNPTLNNCSFQSNSATIIGAAMWNNGIYGTCSPTLTNCSFQANSGPLAAIYNSSENGLCNPSLTNCSFQANSGGAMQNESNGNGNYCNPTLTNCVLFGNGGGNTIINRFGAALSASYSLFDNTVTGYTGSNNLTTTTSPFASTASTQLSTCSPAINKGNPASATVANGPYSATAVPATDLAANPRIVGGRIDMGAYEFQGTPFIAFTAQPPASSTVCVGSTVTASVSVSGTVSGYQWNNANGAVAGQTSATLSLSNVQVGNAGNYSVVVTGTCNSLTSTTFSLMVSTPPSINTSTTVTQPTCTTPTGTIVVNSTVVGGGALEYSINNGSTWQSNATFSSLSVGSYTIKVRLQASPACEATYGSTPVVLSSSFTASPTIGNISTPGDICAGSNFSPTNPIVTANGSTVTSSSWQLETGVGTGVFSNISLPYTTAFTDNGKKVRFAANNDCGTTYSNEVVLTIDDKPSIANITTPADICAGSNFSQTNPTVTEKGSTVTSSSWQLETGVGTGVFSNISLPYTTVYADNWKKVRFTATNGCGTTNSNEVVLTIDDKPSIANITTLADICAGSNFSQTNPVVTEKGSTVTSSSWQLETGVSTGVFSNISLPYTTTYADNGKKVRFTATNGCGTTNSNEVVLTIDDKPSIANITTPADICAGSNFSQTNPAVTEKGSTVTSSSWQLETGVGTGVFSNISLPYTTAYADNGKKVRFTATNGCGTTTSNEVVLTIDDKPSIANITTPADICAGGNFIQTNPAVTEKGSTVTSSSWQLETGVSTGVFSNISLPYTTVYADNGKKVRFTATNGCGTTNSNEVVLTIDDKPSIANITTPADICAGSNFSQTNPVVTEKGSTITSSSWQLETGVSTGVFSNINLPYTTAYADNGKKVRFTATNGCGTTNSNEVVLTIDNKPSIANITTPADICAGSNFSQTNPTVTANGSTVTSSSWQLETGVGTSVFSNISLPYTTTYADNEKKVRFSATNGCGTTTSNEVVLTIDDKPSIANITTPADICAGSNFSQPNPTVTANGSTVTASTWQLETAVGSGTFADITLPYTTAFADNGKKVRFSATNGCGTTTSNEVVLTVDDKPSLAAITTPADICAGSNFSQSNPTVTANGSTVTSSSWQLETGVGTGVFSNISLPYTTAYADNGKKVRFTATNGCGTTTSNEVVLTIDDKPSIANITTPADICAGSNFSQINPTVTANGSTVTSSSWQLETGVGTGVFSNISLPYTTAYAGNGKKVRFTATNGCGTTTSNEVVLSIDDKPSISNITTPADICAGSNFSQTNPTVTANGSTVTSSSWQLETGVGTGVFSNISLPYTTAYADNGKKVRFTATNGCGTTNSNEVVLTIDDKPSIANITTPADICAGSNFSQSNPTVTANGSTVTSSSWQLETGVGTGVFSNINLPYTTAYADNGKKVRFTATNGCGTTNSNVGILTINPLPTASISGTTSICKNGTAPNITFTGSGGTAPYTFTYTLNDGNSQTVSTTGNNTSATVSVPATTNGIFNYKLTNVQDGSSTTCSSSINSNNIATVTITDCDVKISDPCTCENNAPTIANGTFSNAGSFGETVTVKAPTGQTWKVSSVTGLYKDATTSQALAINDLMTESPAGVYTLKGYHVDSIGYSISVTNGRGTTLSTSNKCYYPDPSFAGLPKLVLPTGLPFNVSGTALNAAAGSGTFKLNGVTQSGAGSQPTLLTINPTTLPKGTNTLEYTFNAGAPGSTVNDPGCVKTVTQKFEVAQCGCQAINVTLNNVNSELY